jgi:hypothetical protein
MMRFVRGGSAAVVLAALGLAGCGDKKNSSADPKIQGGPDPEIQRPVRKADGTSDTAPEPGPKKRRPPIASPNY